MIFVPGTSPGDRVRAELEAASKNGGPRRATLLEVLAPGSDRVTPPCRHFGPCGGCEWLHVRYPAQLAAKEAALESTLRRLGKLEGWERLPIIGSPSPWRYRCRAKLKPDPASGRLAFLRRRSHERIPLAECHLLTAGLDALREAVGPAIAAARLAPNEVTLEWSELQEKGSALLDFSKIPAEAEARVRSLLGAVPALAGVLVAAPDRPPLLFGEPVLRHARQGQLQGAGEQPSRPDAFIQANRGANDLLVAEALRLLRPDGEDVLELFCGAGNFTAPLAARAKSVTAVEELGPALELARAGMPAEPRGTSTVRFVAGDGQTLASALAREKRRFGAVLLDPPRAGMRGLGKVLRELGSPRAVYVSCDPATFARDLRGCADAGLKIRQVRPVDLFPQTHHVEAVALIEA